MAVAIKNYEFQTENAKNANPVRAKILAFPVKLASLESAQDVPSKQRSIAWENLRYGSYKEPTEP